MISEFRGVYAIPCTPFDGDGAIDEASLRREVQFCLECGAHGLVGPVNASEFSTLSDAERRRWATIAAEELDGRIPYIVGVSAVSGPVAAEFASHARQVGAAAVIAMPPYVNRLDEPRLFDYYAAIAEAAQLPVFLQDWIPPIGQTMPPPLMARMIREIPGVEYLKEESAKASQVISQLFALCGDELKGIQGGQAGRHIFTEYARGVCGTMPAAELTDVHVRIWNLLEAGEETEARELFYGILPLLNFEAPYGVAAYKEVLRRRGVIATNTCRGAMTPLDDEDLRELDRIWPYVEPLFSVRYP